MTSPVEATSSHLLSDTPLRALTKLQTAGLMIASLAMGAGMTVNFVVVTPLARQAGLSELQVGIMMSISALLFAGLIPFWSRLADRFGRKRVMVFSLTSMGVCNALFLMTLSAALSGAFMGLSGFFILLAVRSLFGLFSPGYQPASMAMMTEATTSKTRAAGIGLLGAGMSIGTILGPAGATLLAPYGALAPIWGSVALSLCAAMILAVILPPSRSTRHAVKRPMPLKMSDSRLLPHVVFLLAYFTAVGVIQQSLGWLVEDRFHVTGQYAVAETGKIFTALAGMMLIVQFGYISRYKPKPQGILTLGLGLVSAGYLAAAFATNFTFILFCFACVGVGAALAVPAANALGSLSVAKEDQGSAAGLLSMAPPAGFVCGPILGGAIYPISDKAPLLLSGTVMAALTLYAFFVAARKPIFEE